MARTARVNIMIDENIKDRLETIARGMGLTVSALGSYIIGSWVYQYEHKLNAGSGIDPAQEIFNHSLQRRRS